MSAVEVEYAATHRMVTVMAESVSSTSSMEPLLPNAVPVPPTPHGWRLCAATAAPLAVHGIANKYHVLYTWFWRRAGRERVVAALGGDGDAR